MYKSLWFPCSQVPMLRNLEFVLCYYVGGYFLTKDHESCTGSKRYVNWTYVVALSPYWCRFWQVLSLLFHASISKDSLEKIWPFGLFQDMIGFLSISLSFFFIALEAWEIESYTDWNMEVPMTFLAVHQSVRRSVDEDDNHHLANAAKYLSAMTAVALKITYTRRKSLGWLAVFVTTSTIATVYQLYWDLVIDWGLLNPHSQNRWLRDQLTIDRKWIYFASMVQRMNPSWLVRFQKNSVSLKGYAVAERYSLQMCCARDPTTVIELLIHGNKDVNLFKKCTLFIDHRWPWCRFWTVFCGWHGYSQWHSSNSSLVKWMQVS